MATKMLFGVAFALVLIASGSSERRYRSRYLRFSTQRVFDQVPGHKVDDSNFREVPTPPDETTATEQPYETCTSVACILQDFLEEKVKSTDIKPMRDAKMFYTSCLRAGSQDSFRALHVVKQIHDQTDGWPMASDQPDSTQNEWQRINDDFIRDYGAATLYSIGLADWRGANDEPLIVIYEPSTILDRREVDSDTSSQSYKEKIAEAARFLAQLGRQIVSEEQIERDAEEVVHFEEEIVKITSLIDDKDDEAIEMSVDELQQEYDNNRGQKYNSEIDWLKTIQRSFDVTKIRVNGNTPIWIWKSFLEYLRKLSELLNETSSRTIVNYVYSRMISKVVSEVDPFVDQQDDMTRWHHCLINHPMTPAIWYAFASTNYVSEEVESATRDLVKSVRKQVAKQILDSGWMDESTKRAASNKMLKMTDYIGFRDFNITKEALTTYYEGLDFTTNYEQNILIWIKWKNLKDLWDIDRSVLSMKEFHDFDWYAFYQTSSNSMYIPAKTMKFSLIGPGVPESISLGTLGAMIGNEIAHAFDSEGMNHDEYGESMDLPRNMKETYAERSQCFVDQYNSYAIPGLSSTEPVHVNGSATLAENIADAAGLSASFAVLSENMKKRDFKDIRLPGFENLTGAQLLFLSYGNFGCERLMRSSLESWSENYENPVPHVRIDGVISNSVKFGEAFNCPVGSRMNPEKKCNIWN